MPSPSEIEQMNFSVSDRLFVLSTVLQAETNFTTPFEIADKLIPHTDRLNSIIYADDSTEQDILAACKAYRKIKAELYATLNN